MNMSIIDVSKLIMAEAYSGGYSMGFWMSGIRSINGGVHALLITLISYSSTHPFE